MAIKFNITMTNKWLYTLIAIVVLAIAGIGVYAYNSGYNNPAVMGHSADELAPPADCVSGDFLQWSGSQWACATVNISAGTTFDLVNGQHSSSQCTGLGGTVVDDGTGKLMCRFFMASCPSGWAQYNIWSTTKATSCSGDTCQMCFINCYGCTTTSHTWSNTQLEKCNYNSGSGDYSGCFSSTCTATRTYTGCY